MNLWLSLVLSAGLALSGAALAQDTSAQVSTIAADPHTGPVTNLPLPRFVSLKGTEGNARRGPNLAQKIDWVFTRRDMPLQITAEFENWRLVQDKDGAGGWVHYILLSGTRSVVVQVARSTLYSTPDERASVVAYLETDVVGRINQCTAQWCRITAGGETGWAPKTDFWGVGPDELLE